MNAIGACVAHDSSPRFESSNHKGPAKRNAPHPNSQIDETPAVPWAYLESRLAWKSLM